MNKRILVLLPLIMVLLLSCGVFGGGEAEAPVEEEVVVVPPTDVPTLAPPTQAPPPTEVPPTEAPTEEVVPEPVGFDAATATWDHFVAAGDKAKDFWYQNGNIIKFEMPSPETYTYAFAQGVDMGDVEVKVVAKTKDSSQNGIAVICRQSDEGWYELRVHTVGPYAGSYSMYRYSTAFANENKNPYINILRDLDRAFTSDIVNGPNKTNTIVLACQGEQLRVFINGKEQFKPPQDVVVTDDVLTSGSVGFGVMSFGNGKVNVEVDLEQMSATE